MNDFKIHKHDKILFIITFNLNSSNNLRMVLNFGESYETIPEKLCLLVQITTVSKQ